MTLIDVMLSALENINSKRFLAPVKECMPAEISLISLVFLLDRNYLHVPFFLNIPISHDLNNVPVY